uniref:Serine aminopeptidase S33 domain-containing protein n=1 Tax=Hanusia phi TaxID=3032 RepID=A0A7S0EJ36_9CRYP|mmetsp:Transcript_24667/g.55768  ORF Transcript_24667/g.55768 Transcript_24667/m.55768 type:complete len:257 (+) Transcript_24667:54-824(+)
MGNHLVAKLAFFPPDPCSYHRNDVTTFVTTSEGSTIPVLHIKCKKKPKFTLLFSHGNAEDIGVNKLFCEWFAEQLQVDIVTYDYTGYGMAAGDPAEKHLYSDSTAVYEWMKSDLKLRSDDIILYGKSLGTAATVDLAGRKPCIGVVLVCPLASGARVVFPKMKNFLLDGVFCPSIQKIGKVRSPIFIMHGTKDEVIDVSNGKDLYEECKSCHPLPPVWVEGAGHNDIESRFPSIFLKGMRMFLDHCSEIKRLRPIE